MDKNKATYERPTTNLLVVRFEQGLLIGSPQAGAAGQAGANEVYNAYDEDF